jgi:predicted DNA-binding protein
MNTSNTTVISVAMPSAMRDQLHEMSQDGNVSVSAIVRDAVSAYLYSVEQAQNAAPPAPRVITRNSFGFLCCGGPCDNCAPTGETVVASQSPPMLNWDALGGEY